MLLRDGRNQVHDLGPRRTFEPSLMKPVGAGGGETGGAWSAMPITKTKGAYIERVYSRAGQLIEYRCTVCEVRYTSTSLHTLFCSARCRATARRRRQGVQPRAFLRLREVPQSAA